MHSFRKRSSPSCDWLEWCQSYPCHAIVLHLHDRDKMPLGALAFPIHICDGRNVFGCFTRNGPFIVITNAWVAAVKP